MKRGGEAPGEGVVGRDLVGNAREFDFVFCANEALRERRDGHEKGAGDFLGGETADGVKRERDLRLGRDGRVAAREDEAERIRRLGSAFLGGGETDHVVLF